MGRRASSVVAIAVTLVVLSPAFHERDSYPLSTYPMFSYPRSSEAAVDTAVGLTRAGEQVRLSPSMIGGSTEVIHAAQTVSKAIRSGDVAVLCGEIAARAAAQVDLVAIQVVTETYGVIEYFEKTEVPRRVVVHAQCAIAG